MEKKSLSTKEAGIMGYPNAREGRISIPTSHAKINSKTNIEPNIKLKTINRLKENTGKDSF